MKIVLIQMLIFFSFITSANQSSFQLRGRVKRNVSISINIEGDLLIGNNSSIPIKVSGYKREITVTKRVTKSKIKKDFELITLQTI